MRFIIVIFFVLIGIVEAYSQTPNEYNMHNGTISDCDGILRDSEDGLRTGEYDHNEDYILTICVSGAASITLEFDSFCTEKDEDYLEFFQGSDTSATQIGSRYSGTNSPGTIKSNDSCITIYFHSDKSVTCFGFKAEWSTVIAPLPQPRFVSPPSVSCEDNIIGVRLDQKFNCDSIGDSSFWVSGRLNPATVSVTPVNCDANNETDTFNIRLNPNLDRSGIYWLDFETVKWDACDSPWVLSARTRFDINDCPIEVELIADNDTVCRGSCTQITAEVTGGDSLNYAFNWTGGISGRFGPHTVCPLTTTTYSLTVSDGAAVPGSDTITIVVVDPPVAMGDTTLCRTSNPFNVTASPAGGTWQGNGITNNSTGAYNPRIAGAGLDTVVYFYAGCTDTTIVDVRNMNAGRPNSACPFSAPFNVFNYTPAGGKWSGPNIDSNGRFTPADTGVFTVTYTWNGCVDTKTINVYPITVPEFDTFCLSDPDLILQAYPVGGRWSGPGVRNSLTGLFRPSQAGAGDHMLIYRSNGCSDTTFVHIISINARWNEVACPDEAPFNVVRALPTGGFWKGVGITDSIAGTYDPSFIYGINRTWYNDTLRYYLNGCVDEKIVYIRQTIVYDDTVKFCIEDPRLLLDWNGVRRTPGGGVWSGNGVLGNYFYPNRAGHGIHRLIYNANNCIDSIHMVVHPASRIQADTNFCITEPPYALYNGQSSGYFKGLGIIDTTGGVFDPGTAGVGRHRIYYYSKFGCADSLLITVYALPIVNITGFDPSYCLKDSLFPIQKNPLGGVFWGSGIVDSFFNPRNAGTGSHTIYYQYGRPTCFSVDSAVLRVIDTLLVSNLASRDTICEGENVNFTALPRGGSGNYSISWFNGSRGSSVITYPTVNTWAWTEVSDGCSDNRRDSVWVVVHPKVQGSVISSEIKCYGEVGFAEVIPSTNDPYEVTWHTSPPRTGFRINAPVANRYNFTLRNTITGCVFDSFATIPGYDRISAYFVTSPREGYCLNPFDPVLNFINQSVGATGGFWSFGDGDTSPYDPSLNPQHFYRPDTTNYTITLVIWNEGGCADTLKVQVCIDDSVYVMMPSAFSPNGDGINDLLHIPTAGVEEFELLIFNRWGEHIFRSTDANVTWDGNYKGKQVQKGAYPYHLKFKGRKTPTRQLSGVLFIL